MFDPLAGDHLRPDEWSEFVGQEPLKERLIKHIDAAVQDLRAPGHTLLIAPPGAGKTTLARLIAKRMGVPLEVLTCPVKFDTIVKLLVRDEFAGVLLLDEIHRLKPSEQEDYLTLIESGYIQFRGEKFAVGWLMVVGATTEKKKLIKPLRDRFPYKPELDGYSDEEISQILQGMTVKLGFEMEEKDADVLAKACVGTPRRARDFALAARDLRVLADGLVPSAEEILDHLRIDEDGLGLEHWRYLDTLLKLGGQAGLRPICSMMGEDPTVIEEIEAVLLEQKLITYSERGRQLRTEAYKRLRALKEPTEPEQKEEE
jgi:Holliday junction DNA helicase RuvB